MKMNMTEAMRFKSGGAWLEARLFLGAESASKGSGIVIILTGDGPSGTQGKTWPSMIDALLGCGLSVCALDFIGQGYSEGDRTKLCLSVACRNFLDAYEALGKRIKLKHYKVGILGSSFGGAVALAGHASLKRYDAIALKSPASFLAESYETEHKFPNGMDAWRQSGVSPVTGLSYGAYIDAIKSNIYASAITIEKPVLIVHGDADDIVPITQSRRLYHLLSANHIATLIELPGVGHDYSQEGAMRSLQQAMAQFFSMHLLK